MSAAAEAASSPVSDKDVEYRILDAMHQYSLRGIYRGLLQKEIVNQIRLNAQPNQHNAIELQVKSQITLLIERRKLYIDLYGRVYPNVIADSCRR